MSLPKIFICFSAKDRYTIAEPIVYHLKNYGIEVWYDRYSMLLGDNREEKNLHEGVQECNYAIVILSRNTLGSICASEEIHLLEERFKKGEIVVFPVLYELSPNEIAKPFKWVKELIFKEVDRQSGSREICNHIACKITENIKLRGKIKSIQTVIDLYMNKIPTITYILLESYQSVDNQNLNSRITLLYAAYLSLYLQLPHHTAITTLASKIFQRIFSETKLDLVIDYRELWLLENAICILVDYYKIF